MPPAVGLKRASAVQVWPGASTVEPVLLSPGPIWKSLGLVLYATLFPSLTIVRLPGPLLVSVKLDAADWLPTFTDPKSKLAGLRAACDGATPVALLLASGWPLAALSLTRRTAGGVPPAVGVEPARAVHGW